MRLLLTLGCLPFLLFSSCNRGLIAGAGTAAMPGLHAIQPSAEWAASNDSVAAEALLQEGRKRVASQKLEDFQFALENYFEPAMRRCSECPRARAWLAYGYLRLIEQTPRDAATFAAIRKLVGAEPGGEVAEETVMARAQWLRLLGRNDEALSLLDRAIASRSTPELLYQRSAVYLVKNMLSEAAGKPGSLAKAGPRELYVAYAIHGNREPAARLAEEFPGYVQGRLAWAELLLKENHPERALELVRNAGPMTAPEKSDALSIEVRALAAMGSAKEALRLSEGTEDPTVLRARLRLLQSEDSTHHVYSGVREAMALEEKGEHEQARAELIRSGGGEDAELAALAGDSFLAEHRFADAENRFLKALALSHNSHGRAAYGLARARLALREPLAAQFLEKGSARSEWLLGAEARRSGAPVEVYNEHYAKAQALGLYEAAAFAEFGRAAEAAHETELAEFYYAIALRYDAYQQDALEGIASARFVLSSPSNAISYLKDKLAWKLDSADAEVALAMVYLRAGDQLEGKNHLINAIRRDTHNGRAFLLLGRLTRDEGNRQSDYSAKRHSYRYALASFEMAGKTWPGDPEPYAETADLYFDIRDLGAAARNYHQTLVLSPRYPLAHLRLAQIARNGGDQAGARLLLDAEVLANPYSELAHVEIGNIFMSEKNFTPALREFQIAAKLNPMNSDAKFGAGVVHHLAGEYDEAISVFNTVIRLDPLKADAYWQLGLLYQKLRNVPKALNAFTNYKAIVREPTAVAKADLKIGELTGFNPPYSAPYRAPVMAEFKDPSWSSLADLTHERVVTLQKTGWAANAGRSPASGGTAVSFANQFSEMKIPAGWACELQAYDWVCQSANPTQRGLAFLVVSAKIKRPGADELPVYLSELGKPRVYQTLSGEAVVSEPRFSREIEIHGHPWVEALQVGWEAPDYYSRIYSTLESDLGVMISFHAGGDVYPAYAASIEELARSLHTFRKPGSINAPASQGTAVEALVVKVTRSFEDLSLEERAEVERNYRLAESSLVRKDYEGLHAAASAVLSSVSHYKDVEFYETLADRENLAELARASNPLPLPVADLEKEGSALAKSVRKVVYREALRNLSVNVLKLDPANKAAVSWKWKIEEADQRSRSPASIK